MSDSQMIFERMFKRHYVEEDKIPGNEELESQVLKQGVVFMGVDPAVKGGQRALGVYSLAGLLFIVESVEDAIEYRINVYYSSGELLETLITVNGGTDPLTAESLTWLEDKCKDYVTYAAGPKNDRGEYSEAKVAQFRAYLEELSKRVMNSAF